jgi:hypothetical protein
MNTKTIETAIPTTRGRERESFWLPTSSRRHSDVPMVDVSRFLVGVTTDLARSRARLVTENALLRQQLIATRRTINGRIRWSP